MSSEWTISARWIFPADGPPLERGTITISGERITAVEPAGSRRPDLDYGNAAILPGLVNAHTHLDLTGLRGRCPPSEDFTGWLREVIRHRRSMTAEQVRADIDVGLSEALQFGTTLLGDISSQGQSWSVLASAPIRAVVFHELLGLTAERAREALAEAQVWLHACADTPTCRAGLSPHAPYSARKSLFEETAKLGRPVAIHLAESRAEQELLRHHAGVFVKFLADMGVWDPDGLAASAQDIIDGFRAVRQVLWVHANYLDPDTPIGPGGTIVYCPRTHAAFGHPAHPVRELLKQGVRVALGTDSLASNPDLNVLAEARFVHQRFPELDGAGLLRMATLNGAQALGFAEETGSLLPGKSADFIVVELPEREECDPHELVFAGPGALREVFSRGQRVK